MYIVYSLLIIVQNRIPDFDRWLVKLGMHNFSETADDAEVTMRINQIEIHENYDQLTKVKTSINPIISNDFWRNCWWFAKQLNDIAILTLESPVKFTDRISTVCLPKECHSVAGPLSSKVFPRTLEWGNTAIGERNWEALHHVTTETMYNDYCNSLASRYSHLYKQIEVVDQMACALSSGDSYHRVYFKMLQW